MTWTPTLKVIERQSGKVHLVVDFTDGVNVATQDYFVDNPQSIKVIVGATIDKLIAQDAFVASLATGVVDTTPDAVVPQTQAQIDASTWLGNYRKWVKVKQMIDTGVLTGSEVPVTNLKALVQSTFKAAYLDMI